MHPKNTPNCVCERCGKAFRVKPSRVAQTRFCSKACFYANRSQGTISKTCAHCGKPFTRKNWKVWRIALYCSPDCYDAYRRSLPDEERERLMEAAREASRTHIQTDEHRYKIALSKQERCVLSGDEATIMDAFQAAGLSPVPLYAIHRYNIDFAFPDIKLAIEYNGGNWHNTPKKVREDDVKFRYLRSEGWRVLVFPRLDKPQANDAGNERITLEALVSTVQEAIHSQPPQEEHPG